MALETFGFIDSLVDTNPEGTDNPEDGDNHLRGIKSTLLTSFPNVNAAVNPTPTEFNRLVGITSALLENASKDVANGVPGLDANGRMAWARLPETGYFSAGLASGLSDADRLFLGAQGVQAFTAGGAENTLLLNAAGGDIFLGAATSGNTVILRSSRTRIDANDSYTLQVMNNQDGLPALTENQSVYSAWTRSDGEFLAIFGFPGTRDLLIRNYLDDGKIRLQALGAGGNTDVLTLSADEEMSVRANGRMYLEGNDDYLWMRGSLNTASQTTAGNAKIGLRDVAGATAGWWGHSSSLTMYLRNDLHQGPLLLQGRGSGGTLYTFASFTPEADTIFNRIGTERLRLTSVGILVNGTASVNTPTASTHAATKAYVDGLVGTSAGNFVPATGGAFTGQVTVPTPTGANSAANRSYVDTAVQTANSTIGDGSLAADDAHLMYDTSANAVIRVPINLQRRRTVSAPSARFLTLADGNTTIFASTFQLSIPPDTTADFPVGTEITIVSRTGTCNLSHGSGVTLSTAGSLTLISAGGTAKLIKAAANTWVASGDLE